MHRFDVFFSQYLLRYLNSVYLCFSFPKSKLCKPHCVDNFMFSTHRDWMSIADREKTDFDKYTFLINKNVYFWTHLWIVLTDPLKKVSIGFDTDLVYQIGASAVNKAPQRYLLRLINISTNTGVKALHGVIVIKPDLS